ncbi:hypothetical protein [Polaromonas sp.]|nr:hypothetical protein [Polaromonas sp.]
MSAPGVVSNGKVVHAGGVPSREKTSHGSRLPPVPLTAR